MGREIIYLLLVARHGWEAFAVVVVVVAFVLVVFVVIVATTTQRDDQTATAKLPLMSGGLSAAATSYACAARERQIRLEKID